MKIHWIFRVVSLFNYQGSFHSLFASDFVIISHRFLLVKHFFKKFLSFFDVLLFSRTACLSYHNSFCLSIPFFKFFKLFLIFRIVWTFRSFRTLRYLITSFLVCQQLFLLFFKSFFVAERRWRDLNPRAGRPTYTLSRGASSATWVHLLAWKFATKVFDFHCYWSAITSVRGLVYQKKIHLSRVFLNFF